MNIAQIETNLQQLILTLNPSSFIYDLLLAYGMPKASIRRLQSGGLNLSKVTGEIAWKKKLFFKEAINEDLFELLERIKANSKAIKHDPRFIVVTDFVTLLAMDHKTLETLDIPILELPKYFDFFLPWAGMEKAQHQLENPADVKAAERMAKLYDEIKKDNPTHTEQEVHNLNVFLTRLLFCFFAEDTGIFEDGLFTNSIQSHTQQDGCDLNTYLDRLFEVMNTNKANRNNLPAYLALFPYVNGGLLRNNHPAPTFSRRSRQAIIDSGGLQWKDINPDIFGSMIQAVITPEHRGGLGMHYTSVPNIMKVIKPLFLDELYEEFYAAKGYKSKLKALLKRIWNIKIFDPACGSGNFLIIAYKELRRLEMKIFKELNEIAFSEINLCNFYGIELDDFAHEVAILSLWLAEHQMNQEFFKEFGRTRPTLPLAETGNIVNGNATRLNWEIACPKNEGDEIYILGNPPYVGARLQNNEQKEDMSFAFKEIDGYNNLDYIACWFLKGQIFIKSYNAKYAFVTTNSICQGMQVPLLWVHLLDEKTEIDFAYQSFKWKNNAKANAAVSVMIVGLRNISKKHKYIYGVKTRMLVSNINPYIIDSENIYVIDRKTNLSRLPEMTYGSMPNDGGHLILSEDDYRTLLSQYPNSIKFIRQFLGAAELMKRTNNYCLWIEENEYEEANKIPFIKKRIDSVKTYRSESKREATVKLACKPYKFGEVRHKDTESIIIPQTGSERRDYLPIDFRNSKTIISNAARVIYNSNPYLFAILSSKIHIVWVRIIAGRRKTDMQYSNTLCYNTFPFPTISDIQKQELEKHVHRILEEREKYSEKTLAQLYDPDKMPAGLREAHHQNDLAVERCYRSKPFVSDEERLEYLFKLYEQMIAEERERGTLFEAEHKTKKKKQ